MNIAQFPQDVLEPELLGQDPTKPKPPQTTKPPHPGGLSVNVAPLTSVGVWIAILAGVYFAVAGHSPIDNVPIVMRLARAKDESTGVVKIWSYGIYSLGLAAILKNLRSYAGLSMDVLPLCGIGLLAIASGLWSQAPAHTFAASLTLILTGMMAIQFVTRYSPNEQMWAVMALGAVCTIASVFLATAYPQFGLDHLGGHDDAWKGIYSAKNLCGEKTLLFLLPALWLRTRSTTAGVLRVAYIGLLVGVLIMSKALTSCALLIPLIAGSWFVKSLTSFGKRERIALSGAVGLLAVGAAATLAYSYSDIMNWVGKDAASLSGRAPIWHAAFASFSKRPLLGYGYDAFWMGLRGESANIILDPRVAWALGQSQNGFFDSCLQLGAVGLGLVFLMAATGLRNCARVLVSARDNEYCWYASIFALGILYNLDESFLLARDDLFWLLFVGAWFKLRELRAIKSPNPHPTL